MQHPLEGTQDTIRRLGRWALPGCLALVGALALMVGAPVEAGGAVPAPPSELEALVVQDALAIQLLWQDNADNEDNYIVERSTAGPEGPWSEIATPEVDIDSYFDSGLEDGVTYWYRVAAENTAGTSAYSNVAFGTATELPSPPLGDVNCSFAVDSIDALLILQLTAGLIATVLCEDRADVNSDGDVDAVDSTLILQFDAGLIPSPSATSGIEGQVLLGPQCPVMQQDVPCPDAPLAATVDVWDAGRTTLVTTFESDANGMFRVALDPGEYYLDPLDADPGNPFPVPEPQSVTVEAMSWTSVTIRYDTGIR